MAEHSSDSMDARASDVQLRDAAPAYEDLEARRARAGVAAALFGGDADASERVAVGRYEIDSRLGAGGMGVVYRAHDPDLDRPVAVKLLHSESSGDDKARARMLREARALAKLSHPNVITVYDVGTDAGQVFVAMELVAGRDLRRWLDEHRQAAWRQVLALFIAAGRGLEAAHEVALVHRDFKPENVLVGDDGRVRVLDFGLARVHRPVEGPTAEDPSTGSEAGTTGDVEAPARHALAHLPTAALAGGLTETGALIGTPLYMAPELYAGKPADVHSDQFAFCASLYEGLYRQLPFGSHNLAAHVEAVRSGRIVEPPDDSTVPAAIWRIIARGLGPDPDARWRSVATLLGELERVAAEPVPTELPEPRGGLRWLAIAGGVMLAAGSLIALELGLFDEPAVPQGIVAASSVVDPGSAKPPETKPSVPAPEPDIAKPEPLAIEPEPPLLDPPALDPSGSEAAAPDTELHGWCHLHEDRYTLLERTSKRRATVEVQGKCYTCRVEKNRDRTRNFSPRDCAGYSLCWEASADACG
jgi:serine/threonine protein kinase